MNKNHFQFGDDLICLKLGYMHRLMKENTAEVDINPGDAENMFHKPSPVPLPLTASSPVVGSFLALSPSALVCPPSQGCSLFKSRCLPLLFSISWPTLSLCLSTLPEVDNYFVYFLDSLVLAFMH